MTRFSSVFAPPNASPGRDEHQSSGDSRSVPSLIEMGAPPTIAKLDLMPNCAESSDDSPTNLLDSYVP